MRKSTACRPHVWNTKLRRYVTWIEPPMKYLPIFWPKSCNRRLPGPLTPPICYSMYGPSQTKRLTIVGFWTHLWSCLRRFLFSRFLTGIRRIFIAHAFVVPGPMGVSLQYFNQFQSVSAQLLQDGRGFGIVGMVAGCSIVVLLLLRWTQRSYSVWKSLVMDFFW